MKKLSKSRLSKLRKLFIEVLEEEYQRNPQKYQQDIEQEKKLEKISENKK